MVWKKTGVKYYGSELEVRTTQFDEIGIYDPRQNKSVFWYIDDTDKMIEEIKKAVEEHKKEKLKKVV